MNEACRQQVRLVLDVLPEVASETCFALGLRLSIDARFYQ